MIKGDVIQYIEENTINFREKTTLDDGSIKIKIYRETIDNIEYLSINEIYIPGTLREKGIYLLRLMNSLVVRCLQDGLRLRFVDVYNRNLINRFVSWGIPDVTLPDRTYRTFQTTEIPQLADLQALGFGQNEK
jgi:hypothetical protein